MKRKNPDTGIEFIRGDERPSTEKQDGYLFYAYSLSKILKTGYFQEQWRHPNTFSKKKLPNPTTGKLWSQGDIREDGLICLGYESRARVDGFKRPLFMTPEVYINMRKKTNYKPNNKSKKRINPKTGKEFVRYDEGERGVFYKYLVNQVNKDNYFVEDWYPSLFQLRIVHAFRGVKARCKKNGYPFDLDMDFLETIFPKDSLCPVLGIKMEYTKDGRSADTSPSIDRIIPSKGYTKGNVIWISMRANRIKTNATPDEIQKVAEFYKKLPLVDLEAIKRNHLKKKNK